MVSEFIVNVSSIAIIYKKIFISRVTIVNEVSSIKVNITNGEQVEFFYVFQVTLKKKDFELNMDTI